MVGNVERAPVAPFWACRLRIRNTLIYKAFRRSRSEKAVSRHRTRCLSMARISPHHRTPITRRSRHQAPGIKPPHRPPAPALQVPAQVPDHQTTRHQRLPPGRAARDRPRVLSQRGRPPAPNTKHQPPAPIPRSQLPTPRRRLETDAAELITVPGSDQAGPNRSRSEAIRAKAVPILCQSPSRMCPIRQGFTG